MRIILWLGVTTEWGTVLKGRSTGRLKATDLKEKAIDQPIQGLCDSPSRWHSGFPEIALPFFFPRTTAMLKRPWFSLTWLPIILCSSVDTLQSEVIEPFCSAWHLYWLISYRIPKCTFSERRAHIFLASLPRSAPALSVFLFIVTKYPRKQLKKGRLHSDCSVCELGSCS